MKITEPSTLNQRPYTKNDSQTMSDKSVKKQATETTDPVKRKRKSPNGVATNDLVLSAQIGRNEELFPNILKLYLPNGGNVADITFGKGVFWRNVDKKKYKLTPSDLTTGVDCRKLPYKANRFDCVVLDPPYMHTPGGTAHNGHQNFESYYKNNNSGNNTTKKYHEAVLDLYFNAGIEANRVLKHKGIFIVKCQDEVCANKQRLTHVELINEFITMGLVCEDVFVLIRNGRPGVSRVITQIHARKNHSYFLVFRKTKKIE